MVEHRKSAKDYWNETLLALIIGGTMLLSPSVKMPPLAGSSRGLIG